MAKDIKRALMVARGVSAPIRAYHGTPYDFDRFDFSKIGAGEGAQAYGHGLYFAGHEPVAKGYRDKLAKDWFVTPSGKFWTPDSLEHLNVRVRARDHAPYLDRAIEYAQNILSDKYSSEETQAKAKRDLDKLIELQKQGGVSPVTGRMYEVAIHADPEKFLDWDRPLRDQRHILEMAAESVGGERAARQAWKDWEALNDHLSGIDYDEGHPLWKRYNQLSALGPDRARIRLGRLYDALDKEAAAPEKYPANRQLTQKGEDLYFAISQMGKTNALGSQALETRGVPGVKYFDALSRGAGEGTSNYVVFPTPEDILEITRKYARGGEVEHPLTQDVYHGTTQNIPEFRDRADDYALSYGLGVHVARDPKVASSEYFTNRNNTGEGGNMMPLKTLPDDKFYPVEQKLLPYLPPDTPKTSRTVRSDDRAVSEAIMKHALKRDPALMKRVLMEQRGLSEEEASTAVKKLRAGEPWQHYDQTYNNIDELVEDHLLSPWNPEDRAWAVRSFRDDLIKKGYAGVKYINTSPNETAGADDPTCYIVFNKPTSEGYYPLRGRFAAFNPEDKASPDLMKSEGGEVERAHGGRTKDERRALMIAREIGSPERQQAFEQWGGSPERWYHGTSKDVDFSKFKVGRHGAWFTRNPETASMYAKENDSQGYKYGPDETGRLTYLRTNTRSRVIPVHLKFGKAHTGQLPDDVMGATNYKKAQSDWFDRLRAQGYDSWVPEGGDVAVILKNPANIKSAIGNVGTFDPTSDDIGKARGGRTKDERRALMIARDQQALLRRVANIYKGPQGGMDPSPGGGGYAGPGGGKYIGPSRYANGGGVNKTYHRFTNSTVDKNGTIGHMMYADNENAVSSGYGKNHYVLNTKNIPSEHIVDATSDKFQHAVRRALLKDTQLLDDFGRPKTAREYVDLARRLAAEAAPKDIVDSAGLWDAPKLVEHVWEHVLEPNNWHLVKTPNGVVSFDPSHAKFAGTSEDHYASGGKIPPFKLHSGAAKLIAQKGQAKATPQQYAALPGIKPDELKYAKFDTLGNKALPKEQVLEHLEGNTVPLQETVYTGDDERSALARYGDRENLVLPNGSNHREVLLHLPEKEPENFDSFEQYFKNRYRVQPNTAVYELARQDALRNWQAAHGKIKQSKHPSNFHSSHWDQPNVLAHIRMSDRKGPNGEKVLHVEEVQSDWGQEGRERGFANSEERARQLEEARAKLDAARDARETHEANVRQRIQKELSERLGFMDPQAKQELINAATREPHQMRVKMTDEEHAKYEALKEAHDNAYMNYRRTEDAGQGIPRGPYVDNTQKWTDLALKRVLHEAAHGGYDKVVFTPGVEQNKRYSLAQHVNLVRYDPAEQELIYQHANGDWGSHENVPPEKLTSYLGKEVAERLLASPRGKHDAYREPVHTLEGKDFEVGGAGMKGYYDNIMPKRLQTLAQQHDPQAKVQLGGHKLRTATESPLRQRIRDAGYEPDEADVQTMLADNGGRRPSNMTDADLDAMERGEHLEYGDLTNVPLHSLDITPQMRDSIKQNGFNQFKRGGDVTVAKKPSAPAIKKSLDLRSTETFPELATRYPKTAPPKWAYDPKKKTDYLAKRLSPEALAVQTAKKVIQKDIDEGRYKPYFDPLKRFDAASSEFGVKAPTTGIKKVKPETQAKYESHARSKEAIERLSGAFDRGMLQARDAGDWYLMGQLHNEYVAKYGPKVGSRLFKERFAEAMAATTGGADPTANFLTSHYGNYVKKNKQQFPEKSYDLPFPIGGRYIAGNIDQYNKMIMQGKGLTPANPKRYNFSHNFLGDPTGATIDEQMSGLYDPKMSVPPEGTYGHYEGALADLAKKTKGAKSPRHFQEVAWAGAKDMGTKGGYKASPMISHINQSIERTARITGMSPEEVVAKNLVDVQGPMFKKGGRAGYADGGGIDRLLQSLRGSFSQLNQQPAPAATDYSQMMGQATGQVPDAAYQQMLTQALGGKSWSDLFPAAAYKPPAAPAAAPAAPAAVEQPAQPAYGPNWSMTSGMDANVSAPGMKRGGAAGQKRKSTVQSDIVERALAATRRK